MTRKTIAGRMRFLAYGGRRYARHEYREVHIEDWDVTFFARLAMFIAISGGSSRDEHLLEAMIAIPVQAPGGDRLLAAHDSSCRVFRAHARDDGQAGIAPDIDAWFENDGACLR
jgi:hypothetical protein